MNDKKSEVSEQGGRHDHIKAAIHVSAALDGSLQTPVSTQAFCGPEVILRVSLQNN